MNELGANEAPKKGNYIYNHIREVTNLNGLLLDSHHKLILMVMESQGKRIFPSYKTLATWTCCSVSTVQRKVKDLEKNGIIEYTRRKDSSNEYTIKREIIKQEGSKVQKARREKSQWIGS
jgi:DNA-binding transcriptional regulator YhcF (GntR family)